MKHLLAVCITVAFTCTNMSAQNSPVAIPGSEIRKITSSIVPGQQYELHVSLPAGYSSKNKKYPVVYLMDSQWDFPLVKSIYGEYYYDGFIPETIIVGVTWGGINPNPDSLRARDYTPTKENGLPQSGGADKFLSFMKEELFPYIENNYRADPGNRILMGCSLGGLLTLYTLFTHPDMFTGYAAASPAVGWDRLVLFDYQKKFDEQQLKKPVRVYMTVGDVERGRPVFENLAAIMNKKDYQKISLHSKVLENTGHSGTKGETYARGLQFIFERPLVKMSNTALNKYTGSYKTNYGGAAELKNENNQLVLYFSGNNKFSLYAAGENEFYATAQFLNLHFKTSNGKIDGFELEQYGGSQMMTKVN